MSHFPVPFAFQTHLYNPFYQWWSHEVQMNLFNSHTPEILNLKFEENVKIDVPQENGSKQTINSPNSLKKKKPIQKINSKKNKRLNTSPKDEEFKQRKQTTNRNLCSNTLKIYFKQLRDEKSETFQNISKIINFHGFDYDVHKFMQEINSQFPKKKNYIIPQKLKNLCRSSEQCLLSFTKILRVSIRHFFQYEIYSVNIKSVRTTRKIRSQQIKQGKAFINEMI